MISMKQLLALILLLTAGFTQPIFRHDCDYKVYDEYKVKMYKSFVHYTNEMQHRVPGPRNGDIVYRSLKSNLKDILKDLKKKSNSATYDQVKRDIYHGWKKSFKNKFEASLISDDWDWLREPLEIEIQE